MTHYFDDLGQTIARKWAQAAYDSRALPSIASDALSARPPADYTDWRDIALHTALATELPPQHNISHTFGQPPVTVFAHPHFYIEVLFWLEGSTDIHQHGFSGAFAVLGGTSIHSEYSFQPERRINGDLILGDLRLRDACLLRPKDVRPIVSGDHLIHSVYHLGRPSATVVVRTFRDNESQPQYTYFYPYVAVNMDVERSVEKRRGQAMSLLWSLGADDTAETAAQAVQLADATGVFRLICDARQRLGRSEQLSRILEAARTAHGSWIDNIVAVADERVRVSALKQLANRTRTTEERLMIALLMLVPDMQQFRSVVAREWPDADPVSTLTSSLFAMASDDVITLGQDNLTATVIRYAVEGVPPESVLDQLEQDYGAEIVAFQKSALRSHCHRIRDMFFAASPKTFGAHRSAATV